MQVCDSGVVYSCECCQISKTTFSDRTLLLAASADLLKGGNSWSFIILLNFAMIKEAMTEWFSYV